MPEAEQGLNVARIASLRAGLPVSAAAVTVNRFCASGLQAVAYAAERIIAGGADAIIAGGTESMSLVPMGGNKVSPNPALVDSYPDVYLTTGLVAENHAARVQHHARGTGRLRAAQPRARPGGAGSWPLRGRDRAAHRAVDSGQHDVRQGRRPPPRHLGRRAGQASPRVSRAGHGYGRQLVTDQRRRLGTSRHVRRVRQGARPHAARPLRRLRHGRGRAQSSSASAPCPRFARHSSAPA